ncbi:hypothetical protein [Clostridium algidicarnis]|uniref:hypothetical protein n=1 Tax=Clostridium algidicarnis TaxID=37659 RepID=UPI003FD7712E
MMNFGINKERIINIAKNNGIEEEKVINAMVEIISENNVEIKRYLEDEYPNVIKRNLEMGLRRMR